MLNLLNFGHIVDLTSVDINYILIGSYINLLLHLNIICINANHLNLLIKLISDDEGRGGVRNPLVSTVIYLTDSIGGPTLVTT
jgi:hypothetical protein